jgi:hypothetical protein
MLVKPGNGLNESLLFSKFLMFLGQITPNRETVHNAAEEIDLVWLLGFHEDGFWLVTFFCGEDLIGFGGCDRKGSSDGGKLGFFDESVGSELLVNGQAELWTDTENVEKVRWVNCAGE